MLRPSDERVGDGAEPGRTRRGRRRRRDRDGACAARRAARRRRLPSVRRTGATLLASHATRPRGLPSTARRRPVATSSPLRWKAMPTRRRSSSPTGTRPAEHDAPALDALSAMVSNRPIFQSAIRLSIDLDAADDAGPSPPARRGRDARPGRSRAEHEPDLGLCACWIRRSAGIRRSPRRTCRRAGPRSRARRRRAAPASRPRSGRPCARARHGPRARRRSIPAAWIA